MSDFTMHHMSCDDFAARLADYLEDDASEAVAEAMATHAAVCERCGELLADLQALPHAAASLPLLEPSRDLWAGIAERIDARVLPLDAPRIGRVVATRRAWLRPAAAAAALVIVTAGITYQLTRVVMTSPGAPVAAGDASTDASMRAPVQVAVTAPVGGTTLPTAEEPARRASSAATSSPTRVSSTAVERRRVPASGVRLVNNDPLREAEPVYDREIATLRTIVQRRRAHLDPSTVAVLEQSIAVIDSAIAQSRAALAKDPASGFLATQLNHSLDKKVELLRTAALLPART